ncbi:MAG TPA: alpha/beta fold hydrolase [Polyangiaceae bacterium]|nr:alpha/beta fold hydrolase [Polyangiaceae bacterium]
MAAATLSQAFSPRPVEFESAGTTCRGWLSMPPDAERGAPLVILGHGFGGTGTMRLGAYAERFHAAGFATLVFDYRRFGESDGEPRQLLVPEDEIADWRAALAYGRTLRGVDTSRIALWGTSFGGGLVVSVAARDGNVAATVSQCPLLDGRAAATEVARYAGPLAPLRATAHALYDLARAAVGASPHYIPIAARPGELGAMTTEDALPGYLRLKPDGFRNEVAARTTLLVPFFRPILEAARVRCPALLQICERDSVAPVSAVEKAALRMPRAEVVRYDVGHFDVYVGEPFERSVQDQTDFLRRHLAP